MNMPIIVPRGQLMYPWQQIAKELGGIMQMDKQGHVIIVEKLLKGYQKIASGNRYDNTN